MSDKDDVKIILADGSETKANLLQSWEPFIIIDEWARLDKAIVDFTKAMLVNWDVYVFDLALAIAHERRKRRYLRRCRKSTRKTA